MTDILFMVMRHGKTKGNDLQEYRSWSNGPNAQLDAEGREGVYESSIYLKGMGYDFPMILCDDLDRTQETASIAASILGIKEIETVPGLKPLNVGDFTGKPKKDHPLDYYLKNADTPIPGGESHNQFDTRMKKVFGDVLDTIIETKQPLLLIGHGSTVSFLHNHMTRKPGEDVGYEGLVKPSGLLMFTKEGIIPLTKLKDAFKNPYADGTALAGFVDEDENVPPRECWNCRNFTRDPQTNTGSCTHMIVRIDPELQSRRQTDGTVAVSDRDCCNYFRNKIST